MATENLMMRSVKRGGDRQELHERVRRHSVAAGARIKERGAGQRPAGPHRGRRGVRRHAARSWRRSCGRERYVGRAPEQVDEFLAEWVEPVLARYAAEIDQRDPGAACLRRTRPPPRTERSLREALREAEVFASAGSVLGVGPGDDDAAARRGAARGADRRARRPGPRARVTRPRDRRAGSRRARRTRRSWPTRRAAANLREMRRDYERAVRLPSALVREMAQTTSARAAGVARRARAERLRRASPPGWRRCSRSAARKAECYCAEASGDRYDALLDEYEPGVNVGASWRRSSPSCASAWRRSSRRSPHGAAARRARRWRAHVPLDRQQAPSTRRVAAAHGLRLRRRPAGHLHPPLLPGRRPRRHAADHALSRGRTSSTR